jgi:hypothetical protein
MNFDRFVDLLLDRRHPFWADERQAAVYTEAATAALNFQAFAVVVVASATLLVGGKPVLGAVTALVLAATCGQYLIMAILTRRHVDLFPGGWRRQMSKGRAAVTLVVALLYVASALWVLGRSQPFDPTGSDVALAAFGLAVGGGAVGALSAWSSRRAKRAEHGEEA